MFVRPTSELNFIFNITVMISNRCLADAVRISNKLIGSDYDNELKAAFENVMAINITD